MFKDLVNSLYDSNLVSQPVHSVILIFIHPFLKFRQHLISSCYFPDSVKDFTCIIPFNLSDDLVGK